MIVDDIEDRYDRRIIYIPPLPQMPQLAPRSDPFRHSSAGRELTRAIIVWLRDNGPATSNAIADGLTATGLQHCWRSIQRAVSYLAHEGKLVICDPRANRRTYGVME